MLFGPSEGIGVPPPAFDGVPLAVGVGDEAVAVGQPQRVFDLRGRALAGENANEAHGRHYVPCNEKLESLP